MISTMVPFGTEHAAVHYPKDRRFRVWVRPAIRIGIAVVALALVLASWIEFAAAGLPTVSAVPWGAPRIHGELLMLGFDVSERTISRWMKRAR